MNSPDDWDDPADSSVPQPIVREVVRPVRSAAPNLGRNLPINAEAEIEVLGACLVEDSDTLDRCIEAGLTDQAFHMPQNRVIYQTLLGIHKRGDILDLAVLAQELMEQRVLDVVGGMAYLMQITQVKTTIKAGYFIEKVRQAAGKREIIARATALVEHAFNGDTLEEVQQAARAITTGINDSADNIDDLLYDPSKDIEKPTPIYTAAGTTICTPGNLTTFKSQAKAGKTAIIGAMIAAACDVEGSANDTLGFRGVNTKGRAVLCFDTEQSRYDWQQMIKTAMRRVKADKPPKWLRCYHLTGKTAMQSRKIIARAITKAKKDFGGIFAIFIDGVADLCLDVNDAAESNELVSQQHAIAIDHDCAIINVLHMNAGSENEKGRGHLGSQLERKSESNLTLEKKDDTTSYWGVQQRGKMIVKDGAPSFKWSDEAGMHVSCGAPEAPKKGAKKTKFLEDYLSTFAASEDKALTFPQTLKKADAKYPISRDTFWNLVVSGVETGEIQVNRANPNEPRYWTTRV